MKVDCFKVWRGNEDGLPDEDTRFPGSKRIFRVRYSFLMKDVWEIEEYTNEAWDYEYPRMYVTIRGNSWILEYDYDDFNALWTKFLNDTQHFRLN